jgi:prevent-host-death family protein
LTRSRHDHKLMTMSEGTRRIPAGEFKAKCLALLDEVAETGRTVVVTKRGRPVARVSPIKVSAPRPLLGSVLKERDLVSPTRERWHEDR